MPVHIVTESRNSWCITKKTAPEKDDKRRRTAPAALPSEASGTDWKCKVCGNVNWERRLVCNMCKKPKDGTVPARSGKGGGFNERNSASRSQSPAKTQRKSRDRSSSHSSSSSSSSPSPSPSSPHSRHSKTHSPPKSHSSSSSSRHSSASRRSSSPKKHSRRSSSPKKHSRGREKSRSRSRERRKSRSRSPKVKKERAGSPTSERLTSGIGPAPMTKPDSRPSGVQDPSRHFSLNYKDLKSFTGVSKYKGVDEDTSMQKVDVRSQYLGLSGPKVNTREPPGGRSKHAEKWGALNAELGTAPRAKPKGDGNERWKLPPTSVQKVGKHFLTLEREEQQEIEKTVEHKWAHQRVTTDKGDNILLDMLADFD